MALWYVLDRRNTHVLLSYWREITSFAAEGTNKEEKQNVVLKNTVTMSPLPFLEGEGRGSFA
jgi:hypothetical protein